MFICNSTCVCRLRVANGRSVVSPHSHVYLSLLRLFSRSLSLSLLVCAVALFSPLSFSLYFRACALSYAHTFFSPSFPLARSLSLALLIPCAFSLVLSFSLSYSLFFSLSPSQLHCLPRPLPHSLMSFPPRNSDPNCCPASLNP